MNNDEMLDMLRKNIRYILKSIGVTQKDFAQSIGMTTGQLNNKMNAGRDFSVYEVIKIADELGEYVEDLCKKDFEKEGFIDGARWGMKHAIEWHKAEELPPMETNYYTINVLTDTQEIAYFDIQTNEWIRDSSSTIIDTPSHWCKLPTYKE